MDSTNFKSATYRSLIRKIQMVVNKKLQKTFQKSYVNNSY